MAQLTPRFGLSYFGGPVPGSLTQDGAKFTLFDPQIVDWVLAALEDHNHGGGVRVADPGTDADDAPTADLEATGGVLPAGRHFFYSFSYVDQFGLETARSAEATVFTPAAIRVPLPPSATKRDPQTAIRTGQLAARVVAIDPVTLSGVQTVDGVALKVGDRVLVTDQGDTTTNGLYTVATGAWTRTTDTIAVNTEVWVSEGTTYNRTLFLQTAALSATKTKQTWIQVPGLRGELYSYALTAIAGEQETPLSISVQFSPTAKGATALAFPNLPDGATEFEVWRKAFSDPGWTRIGRSNGLSAFIDDGRVPMDKCACDPENMPPSMNTTNAEGRVHIVMGLEQQHDLEDEGMGIRAWRLYRTEVPDAYGARSLVEEIQVRDRTTGAYIPKRRNDDDTADLQVWETYDEGDPLLVGSPLEASTTLTPTQPIPIPTGDLPTVLSDFPLHTMWLEEDTNQLYVLTNINDTRHWTPVVATVAAGSIRDEHIAADAHIAMSKLALEPLLTRVTTLESGVATLSADDATTVTYRGAWAANTAYLANDLVTNGGGFYLAPTGIPAAATFNVAAGWLLIGNGATGSGGGGVPAAGSITNAQIADNAGIATSKIANFASEVTTLAQSVSGGGGGSGTTDLTDVLARLTALESGGTTGAASAGRDDTALHYRGAYVAGQTYLPNDLVLQGGQLYLTSAGQPGGNLVTHFDQPTLPAFFKPGTGADWQIENGRAYLRAVAPGSVNGSLGSGSGLYPLLADVSTTHQDFSVRLTAENYGSNNRVLFLGVDDARTFGYAIEINPFYSGLQVSVSRHRSNFGGPLSLGGGGGQFPLPGGTDARNHDSHLRATLEDVGSGYWQVTLYCGGVQVVRVNDIPQMTPGTNVGIYAEPPSTGTTNGNAWWDDFNAVVPTAFSPASWTAFPPS